MSKSLTSEKKLISRLTVKPLEIPQRLDAWLAAQKKLGLTRSKLQKLIESGGVTVDGEQVRGKHKLEGGEKVEIELPPPTPTRLKAQPMKLNILYEDEDLLVIDKPAGLTVHPGAGQPDGTLANAALAHMEDDADVGDAARPGIVHRLDKDTTGCIAIAKSQKAHEKLSGQFADKSASRTYLALVWGNFNENSGLIDAPLGRSPKDRRKFTVSMEKGKEARTRFRVKTRFAAGTLLELKLETGRTHQIRAHLHSIGRPVLGDPQYGETPQHVPPFLKTAVGKAIKRQALHAWKLELDHPVSGKRMSFEAPIPADFSAAQAVLKQTTR